jgi:hypothetical protein
MFELLGKFRYCSRGLNKATLMGVTIHWGAYTFRFPEPLGSWFAIVSRTKNIPSKSQLGNTKLQPGLARYVSDRLPDAQKCSTDYCMVVCGVMAEIHKHNPRQHNTTKHPTKHIPQAPKARPPSPHTSATQSHKNDTRHHTPHTTNIANPERTLQTGRAQCKLTLDV